MIIMEAIIPNITGQALGIIGEFGTAISGIITVMAIIMADITVVDIMVVEADITAAADTMAADIIIKI